MNFWTRGLCPESKSRKNVSTADNQLNKNKNILILPQKIRCKIYKQMNSQAFGPIWRKKINKELCFQFFIELKWTGCCRDSRSACSPWRSWSTSLCRCRCRHRRRRRRPGCWAAERRSSYAWIRDLTSVLSGTQRTSVSELKHFLTAGDKACGRQAVAFTGCRSAELWAGSGAARWPPAARPGLSAASSCCVPVGRSPPQPRPPASLRPSDEGSAKKRKN